MNNSTRPANAPETWALDADLSPAARAIETAYRAIRRRYPDVPAATIVIKRDERAWGHTTVSPFWSPATGETADRIEIMISGENLARGARAVAATLIHEAAHARNLAAGVRDCDVNGRHNARFRDTARDMGLTVEKVGWHGWSATILTDDQAAAWAGIIRTIEGGLSKAGKAHRPGVTPVPPAAGGGAPVAPVAPIKRGNRNLPKHECACGHSIRASRTVINAARPRCEECGERFVEVGR